MTDEMVDRVRRLKLMIFDVDGVLTDGTLYFSEAGTELKAFNARDGHGIKMLRQSGVEVAILSARSSRAVDVRAAELGITLLEQGVADKGASFEGLVAQLRIPAAAAGYMGDDVVDLPVMRFVGLALSVPAAPQVVRDRAHYVSQREAGYGAVREVCELILGTQGTLDAQLAPYLK
jgi:3-deoxy-D-manno-octulosonate 8-phosphate phosphatase (KDO 8-P phosphatase)